MNYLNTLPSELLIQISSYLRYKEINILNKITKISYEDFLKIKYPGFYHIVNNVKRENPVYEDYSWKSASELIDKIDRYVEKEKLDIKSNNHEEVINILSIHPLDIVHDIIAAYFMYTTCKEHEYYKYIKDLPLINRLNESLLEIFSEYEFNDETIEKQLDKVEYAISDDGEFDKDFDNYMTHREINNMFVDATSGMLYLSLAINTLQNKELREKILNLKFSLKYPTYQKYIINLRMIHNYIVDNFN